MLRKPLLPEWRYWPAIPFGSLFALAIWIVLTIPSPPAVKQHHAANAAPNEKSWQTIDEFVAVIAAMKADTWIAAFTGLTTLIFLGQLFAMWRTNTHFRVSERAYVKLSHHAPGIIWDVEVQGRFFVVVQTRNFGRTPARIIAISLRAFPIGVKEPLPELPPYNDPAPRGAFLVADEKVDHTSALSVTAAEKKAILAGTKRLAFFGYTDYIDRFRRKHRAGYGRWYDPSRDVKHEFMSDAEHAERTNLTYIEDAGYNYDIELSD